MHRYSPAGHGSMLADRARVDAYARAIRELVKPGGAVLEIGTGTGLFAILACRQGARRVYAIERDDIIEAARQDAARNGCGERIRFIQAMSTDVELPERVDVVISDMRGVLPWHERHIEAIADARRRFLAPGGRLIPAADRVFAACIEAADVHREMTAPWSVQACGVDLAAARELVVNHWQRIQARGEQLVTAPVPCGELDYATVEDPHFSARVTLVATRAATAHGLCLWFDTTLAATAGFSNAPGGPGHVYGQAFFPWPRPVDLDAGAGVEAAIEARLVGEDYVWSWETRLRDAKSGEALRLRQSNLLGVPLSTDTLRRRADSYVPAIDDDARVDRIALGLMEEGAALGAIARQLAERFPARFARWEEALAHAGELSLRYGR